jgi:type III secretion protein Q
VIALPTLSPLGAAALSRLAPRLPLPVQLGEEAVVLSLASAASPTAPADWPATLCRVDGVAALLRLSPALLPQAAREAWPEIAGLDLPPDLAALLRGVLLAELSALAQAQLGLTPCWEAAEEAERPHGLLLCRGTADGPLLGTVALDDAALDWLARRMAALPARAALPADLAVPFSVQVDRLAMRRAELAALTLGDVVLLDRDPAAPEGGLLVLGLPQAGGRQGFRARLAAGALHIITKLEALMDTPEAPRAALGDLPVTVECEVGRLTLTLAQLQELAPGQVLEIGAGATPTVTLRVAGQAVAAGELVRIADRVGVRIATLADAAA